MADPEPAGPAVPSGLERHATHANADGANVKPELSKGPRGRDQRLSGADAPTRRTATGGGKAAAPPYTDVDAYRATIDLLTALDLDLLLTCHYPVIRGEEVAAFLAASRAWSDLAGEVTRRLLCEAGGCLTLAEAIDRANPLLGPFAAPRELQWALLAHLEHEVTHGEATRTASDGIVAWASRDDSMSAPAG